MVFLMSFFLKSVEICAQAMIRDEQEEEHRGGVSDLPTFALWNLIIRPPRCRRLRTPVNNFE